MTHFSKNTVNNSPIRWNRMLLVQKIQILKIKTILFHVAHRLLVIANLVCVVKLQTACQMMLAKKWGMSFTSCGVVKIRAAFPNENYTGFDSDWNGLITSAPLHPCLVCGTRCKVEVVGPYLNVQLDAFIVRAGHFCDWKCCIHQTVDIICKKKFK